MFGQRTAQRTNSLSDEYFKALRSVEVAERAEVKLAVNQQMRWDAGIRCAKLLIDDGWLGTPTYAAIQVHCKSDWSLWPWIYCGKRLEIMFHSIHYIDSFRYLLGNPRACLPAAAALRRNPPKPRPKRLPYGEHIPAQMQDLSTCATPPGRMTPMQFRLEGTEGVIKGNHRFDVQLSDWPSGHSGIHV